MLKRKQNFGSAYDSAISKLIFILIKTKEWHFEMYLRTEMIKKNQFMNIEIVNE